MTTSVVASAFGGPEVLSVLDGPAPNLVAGEVRIEVHASGTNPVDYKLYSGSFGTDVSQLPIRLGSEVAGLVIEAADGVEGPSGPISVGDEVIGYRVTGGYATEIVVAASSVVAKPEVLSYEEAGGLMLTGTTAVHTLTATGVGRGDTVVVHAAAGGVGMMVVQLAVERGARVIGTASEGRHPLLAQLGAEPVSYGAGLVDRIRGLAPDGVDAAIDAVGSDEAIDASLDVVADRSRIATIAAFGRGPSLGIKVLGGGPGADPGTAIRDAARLELVSLAGAGKLQVVVVARTYPLREAAAAHRELAGGHTHGKIILVS